MFGRYIQYHSFRAICAPVKAKSLYHGYSGEVFMICGGGLVALVFVIEWIILSSCGKHEAGATVPVLFINLFLMLYELAVSIPLYLCVSLSR